MKCPLCINVKLVTVDTREENFGKITTRKKECPECLTRFETTEKVNYSKLPRYILDKMHDRVDGEGRKLHV